MFVFKDWPLATVSILLLVGLALGNYLKDWLLPSLFLILISFLLALALFLVNQPNWQIISLIIGLTGIGMLIASLHWLKTDLATEQSGSFLITVKSSPITKLSGQLVYIDFEDGQRLRATFPGQVNLEYGQIYQVSGKIEPPRQDVDFNEKGFLLAHRATGRLLIREFELVGRRGNFVLVKLHQFKRWLSGRLSKLFSGSKEQLIAGVLIGDNSNISSDLEEIFRRTGTSHILVASGSNVLIIAWVAAALLGYLGPKRAAVMSVLLVACFVVVSGADASIVRAGIFYLLVVGATFTGRRVHALTLATLVALVMALINPWLILHDVAFQLSFAAVLGLLVFSDWLLENLKMLPFAEILAPTLAAELATLPILIFHFGQVSLIAPLANLVVNPLIPLLMAGSALSLCLPWLVILPWVTEGLAVIVIEIINRLSQLEWASYQLPAHHLGWTLSSIALIVIIYLVKRIYGPKQI